ncbi:hypothetical protein ACHAWF_007262 [Thalassiosira exigua]
MVSAQPCLVPQERGQLTRKRIWGATVFVDYATKWLKVDLLDKATGEATLQAKESFENACATCGVTPKHYHADNGRFAEETFVSDCRNKKQKITFCDVGAHHQNGVAENSIKQLTLTSRTLLLHAQRHWLEYISTRLWPLALLAAANRLNNLHVDLDGMTPEMKFSGTAGTSTRLKHFHTFGCPCYILDSRLQDTGTPGPPKWDPCERLGIYVGHSPAHAKSVVLVLNPKTGLISPQFHVAFDDDFSTVPHLRAGTVPSDWAQLVQHSKERCIDGYFDITKTWFDGTHDPAALQEGATTSSTQPNASPQPLLLDAEDRAASSPLPAIVSQDDEDRCSLTQPNEGAESSNLSSDESLTQPNEGALRSNLSSDETGGPIPGAAHIEFHYMSMPSIIDLATAGLRRSTRQQSKPERFGFASVHTRVCAFGLVMTSLWASNHDTARFLPDNLAFAAVNEFQAANKCFDGTLN